MTVDIYSQNEQDKIPVSEQLETMIEDVIKETLKSENFASDCMVSVTLTDNENIREINNEQRNIDSATDVLSFPVLEFENGELVENIGDVFEDRLILGDIVVSLERAKQQCEEFGHSFEREVGYLVCHSVLHLLGYDHEDEAERAVMREKEENVMSKMMLSRG